MKGSTIILLGVLAASTGLYWYQATAAICPVPLSYRLGTIDDSFSLSRDEALSHIQAAEAVWEMETGRNLFTYDKNASFSINFVFDERQEQLNEEARERQSLDERRAENESIVETVETLQAEYESLRQRYDARVAAYEEDLSEYNETVRRYNDRGGAPPQAFAELEEEREELSSESNELNETSAELNQLAARIADLSEEGNTRINDYNRDVADYNQDFGYVREFTQGDYQGDEINIYTFTTDEELESVLAHEFGHALGIGHVETGASLMYYLMEEPHSAPELSDADLTAFQTVCGDETTTAQRIRHMIRSVFGG